MFNLSSYYAKSHSLLKSAVHDSYTIELSVDVL